MSATGKTSWRPCSSRIRGTSCSAPFTTSTAWRSTPRPRRASGRSCPWRRSGDATSARWPSSPPPVTSTCVAHPDLPKIFGRRPEEPLEYPALNGVALEISTNGRYKPVGELYPDPAFLDAAKAPITLASDAHVPANVGRDFDQAVELARAAGYETVTVFEGRRARQEPLG